MNITKCGKKLKKKSVKIGNFIAFFPNFAVPDIAIYSDIFLTNYNNYYGIILLFTISKPGIIRGNIFSNQPFLINEFDDQNLYRTKKFTLVGQIGEVGSQLYYQIPNISTIYNISIKSKSHNQNFTYTYNAPSFLTYLTIAEDPTNIIVSFDGILIGRTFNIVFEDLTQSYIGYNAGTFNTGVSGTGYTSTNGTTGGTNQLFCLFYANKLSSNISIDSDPCQITFAKSNYTGFSSGETVYFNCLVNESSSINTQRDFYAGSVLLQVSFTI
jgi:hypothetical protein